MLTIAEYIGCRNCKSPDCKGCNLKNLETMLNNGKFDCLMDGNRCINPATDVGQVVHGRWIYDKKAQRPYCSVCKGYFYGATNSPMSYCPNCGTKMDEGKV